MKQKRENEDQMLIANAKEGSTEAFESLVRKYQKSIYYLCRVMTGTHHSADDLSQETFVNAYFSLSSFKEGMNFFPWIRKIAVNKTLNYLKKMKRELPLDSHIPEKNMNPGKQTNEKPLNSLHMDELNTKISESIHNLPDEMKSVFILKVYEDMSYKEISDILHIPPGTVMSRLNRARQKLKSSLSGFLKRGTK